MKQGLVYRAATLSVGLALIAPCISRAAGSAPEPVGLVDPGQMKKVGAVDERFLSYNVESVEVTGGNFWAPYPKVGEGARPAVAGPHGTEFATGAYERREPINLTGNERLRMLTKALGPAYMRVSGTWANSIFFQKNLKDFSVPKGYQGILTQAQWAGVVAFAKAVDAKILTSFATSEGARDADGGWNSDAAERLFKYTKSLGGRIGAVELTNEPNANKVPYAAQDFARDQKRLRDLVSTVSPATLIVGPGSTGEAGFKLFAIAPDQISTARLLSGNPQPRFDIFSYHFYGAVSQRCKALGERPGSSGDVTTSRKEALSEDWLARADQAQQLYAAMRDRFAPSAPIWITETAQTACGGDPWSSSYLDTFRFVDQLGRLAKGGANVIFHNTLAASDYALIDDVSWTPRPNYWAALLWRRLMGQTVLDAGMNASTLHVYAHCLRDVPGGVSLVAVNLNTTRSEQIFVPAAMTRYQLSANGLEEHEIMLNGKMVSLTPSGRLPALRGVKIPAGQTTLPPSSITFLAAPNAGNPVCR